MAHCAIYPKGSDTITYFVKDCIQEGRNFTGSNMKLTGVKEYLFDTFWTEDIANPVYNEKKELTGYDKKVSELSQALRYEGFVVSTRQDVNRVIKTQIRAKYSLEDEIKLNRRRDQEWKDYSDFVEQIVSTGRTFKDRYFPQEVDI